MLAVSVEFLLGTFRGDPDGTANTGRLTQGEWPPTPLRLFAALVSADGTRQRCRVTDGRELNWLERLPAPRIYADSSQRICNQPLHSRFVVEHGIGTVRKTHQEYVARHSATVRPGVRVSMSDPRVVYQWDVDVPADILQALRFRSARIGYLGSADSPVRVQVGTSLPDSSPGTAFEPDENGNTILATPQNGDVDTLDRIYDEWCNRGASVSRLQFPALGKNAAYRSPDSEAKTDCGSVVAWLRLDAAVSGRRITLLATLFKSATLSHYQRLYGTPPSVLHGHGLTGRGYELARFLALPDVGYRYSHGRIHGLALWMPPSEPETRQKVKDAVHAIRRLSGHGINVEVAPRENELRPTAAHPKRWLGPSTRWATAFPAIHERRRTLDLPELARWCQHAGLPEPTFFRSSRTPFLTGAADLAPVEVNRPGRSGISYSHVALQFANPVVGPVVIGSGRQRGFGLCAPIDGQDVLQ